MARYNLLSIIGLFSILSGCTSNVATRSDLAGVDKKVVDMRSFQAELTAQVTTLQEEINRLSGKVEELEYRLNRGSAPAPMVQNQVTQPAFPGSPGSAVTGGTAMGSMSPATPSAPPAVVPLPELADDEMWSKQLSGPAGQSIRDALYFVRHGKFSEAQPILSQLATSGGSPVKMNALFWLAVCYEGSDQVRNALGTYNEVMKSYPGQERSRVALLRIADIFARLGDKGTARLTLQKLVTEAPKSKQADLAREKLKSL